MTTSMTPRPVPAGTSRPLMEVVLTAVRQATSVAKARGLKDVRFYPVSSDVHGWGQQVIAGPTTVDVFVPPHATAVVVVHAERGVQVSAHDLPVGHPGEGHTGLLAELLLTCLPQPPSPFARRR